MQKQSILATFSIVTAAVATTVMAYRTASAQESQDPGKELPDSLKGIPASVKLDERLIAPFREKPWEPRLTPAYHQYLIKSVPDGQTYATEEEAKNRLKKNPKDWKAFATLAMYASFREDQAEVIKNYRECVKLYPENYVVQLKLAVSLLVDEDKKRDEDRKKDKEEAIKILKMLSSKYLYQETRSARIKLRELGFSTPDPESEFVINPYTGKKD